MIGVLILGIVFTAFGCYIIIQASNKKEAERKNNKELLDDYEYCVACIDSYIENKNPSKFIVVMKKDVNENREEIFHDLGYGLVNPEFENSILKGDLWQLLEFKNRPIKKPKLPRDTNTYLDTYQV